MLNVRHFSVSLAVLVLLVPLCARGEEAKEPAAEMPQVLMAIPLAVTPGETKSLVLRGLKLDEASGVKLVGGEVTIETVIKKKEKAGVPDKLEASAVGDTLVEVAFQLPEDLAGESFSLVVTAPAGESQPYALAVLPATALVVEKDPNDSLRNPQRIEIGQTICGTISQAKDVDVFAFAGKAGQAIVIEGLAASHGSACDLEFMLYDSAGQIVAIADDGPSGRDPLTKLILKSDDDYRLVILDATDRGGNVFPYLVSVRAE